MKSEALGIILIDKPVGPSSFDVVRKVRKLAGTKSVGHAGTLDPLASGVMVVCLGRYTKLAGYLTEQDKVYDAVFKFGQKTTTDDVEGDIIAEKDTAHITSDDVAAALNQFHGTIMQAPPRFSAVKIDGQRAYKKARADEEFEIAERGVDIFSLTNLVYRLPELSLRIHCSKGTYIRSLARDVGEHLGVYAHATSIRRIRSGSFDVADAIGLDDLTGDNVDARLMRGRAALSNLVLLEITEEERRELSFGRNPFTDLPMASDIAIAVCNDDPVAIMRNDNGRAVIARVI